jgi:hypothetical protein
MPTFALPHPMPMNFSTLGCLLQWFCYPNNRPFHIRLPRYLDRIIDKQRRLNFLFRLSMIVQGHSKLVSVAAHDDLNYEAGQVWLNKGQCKKLCPTF